MLLDDPRHGTYAGYKAERLAGAPPCDACREANRAYRRDYHRARSRAMWRLVAKHRVDFDALVAAELLAMRKAS